MKRLSLALLALIFLGGCATQSGSETVWIDVRSAEEYNLEHREGAINIEFTEIVAGVREAGFDQDAEILLYCGSGRRAGIALEVLEDAGYSNVTNRGGIADVLAN